MSLHDAALHLASRGRGDDSLLIHMTPREVAGLDALARKHYGQGLTTNPDTGLPEAGILGSVLPMLAGGLLAATGIGAPMAALMVGGGTALATGSLQKGLMAGLGAFGGAGLGEGLAGMGSAAASASAAAGAAPSAATAATTALPSMAAEGGQAAMGGLDGLAGDLGSGYASNVSSPAYMNSMDAMDAAAAQSIPQQTVSPEIETASEGYGPGYEATKAMSPWDKMQAGVGQIGQPGSWDAFKQAQGGGNKWMMNAGMAAAPLLTGGLGGAKVPKPEDKSMIRPYDYDQFTQRFTPRAPIRASEGRLYADGGAISAGGGAGGGGFLHGLVGAAASQNPMLMSGTGGAFGNVLNGVNGVYTGPSMKSAGFSDAMADAPVKYLYDQATQKFTKVGGPGQLGIGVAGAGGGGPGGGNAGHAANPFAGAKTQLAELASLPMADGFAGGGGIGQLLNGPGDGVSDSIPAHINGNQPAALADGEYIVPARVVSELGNGSTGAGAKRLDQMVQRVQKMRSKTAGSKDRVAVDSGAYKAMPA